MSGNYVRGASLTAAASQSGIQEMLAGAGAAGLGCSSEDGRAAISCASGGRQYRMVLALPRSSEEPLQPAGGHARKTAREGARQRWRALAVLIRAKLDAVGSGIVTFDQEFLAYALTPQRGLGRPAFPARERGQSVNEAEHE